MWQLRLLLAAPVLAACVDLTRPVVSGTISLQADRAYDIRVGYFDNTGNASAPPLWSSASQTKEVIPTSRG